MQPYERKQLLERVEREGATVGASIPDRLEVQGSTLELREFIFELSRREDVPAADRERVDEAKTTLRRERVERLSRLEEGDITWAEGEELAASIVGIDRALTALQTLGETDLEAEAGAREAADRKRWLSFLRQVTGRDENRSRRRGR